MYSTIVSTKGQSIAIIPARGGSKRIPDKNIREMCGVPLIERTIRNLLEYNIFERIIVSTDSQKIAEIASKSGAETPFLREKGLADDITPTLPVIQHAIRELQLNNSGDVASVWCVYPGSFLVGKTSLLEALDNYNLGKDNCFHFAAVEYSHPIQRSFKLTSEGALELREPSSINRRTQDLEKSYYDAGQFYLASIDTWNTSDAIISESSKAVVLPRTSVCDLDTLDDWALAEAMFFRNQKEEFGI